MRGVVGVDGPGEDGESALGKGGPLLEKVHVESDGDVRVGHDHVLEDARVPVLGQRLVLVREVPVVPVGADGNAREHGRVELLRPLVPLLVGVVLEDGLVQLGAGPGQRGLLAVLRVGVDAASRVEPRLHLLLGVHVRVEQLVDGLLGRGDGHDLVLVADVLHLALLEES